LKAIEGRFLSAIGRVFGRAGYFRIFLLEEGGGSNVSAILLSTVKREIRGDNRKLQRLSV